MTVPDLPMWERLLAFLNPVGWAQVERLRAAGAPDEEALQVVGHNIETLDRLLTVLAVPSDAAVEEGARADWDMTDGKRWGMPWEDVHPELQADRLEWMRRVLTAVFAAVKEGRA
jgi:hypothetical protein